MYSKSAPVITVEPLEALGIDPVVGPRGGSALRPRPETHVPSGRAIEFEGGGGACRGAIMVQQSLFTSALQYRTRVQGQRDAALEPLDAG